MRYILRSISPTGTGSRWAGEESRLVLCSARIAKTNYSGSHPLEEEGFSAAGSAGSFGPRRHALFDIAVCDVKEVGSNRLASQPPRQQQPAGDISPKPFKILKFRHGKPQPQSGDPEGDAVAPGPIWTGNREPMGTMETTGLILLTGGTDVDPTLYAETPSPNTEPPDPARGPGERRGLPSRRASP